MITYTSSVEEAADYTFRGFCQGWKKPLTPCQLLDVLRNSTHRILAVEKDEHRVVGIITALSDGANWAFISYLEVLEGFRHQGIGSTLVRRMLSRLEGIACIDLTCDEDLQPFYEKLGMMRSHGMVIRRCLQEPSPSLVGQRWGKDKQDENPFSDRAEAR